MPNAGPRVVLVDDHALLSLGLREELSRVGVTAWIADLLPRDQLLAWIESVDAELVVLDLGLPYGGGGAALVGPVLATGKAVMVLTGESDVDLWASCLEAGALGVVSKGESLQTIVDAVLLACGGQMVDPQQRDDVLSEARLRRRTIERQLKPFTDLSGREAAVLAGLIAGLSASDLAERDFVSIQTIRTQIKSVLRKLGVSSQLEAVALARQAGWSPEGS